MAGKRRGDSDRGEGLSWAVIIVMFAIGLWPVGLLLLFLKLWNGGGQDKKLTAAEQEKLREAARKYTPVERPVVDLEPAEEAKPPAAREAARALTRTPRTSGRLARLLQIGGGVVLALGAVTLWDALDTLMLFLPDVDFYDVWEALQAAAVCLAGGAALFAGLRMSRRRRRNEQYLSLLGQKPALTFAQLGRMMGLPQGQVARDLRDMWDRGDLPEGSFLDLETGTYFASIQAAEDAAAARRAAGAAPPPQSEEGWSGLLRSIRRINDAIADPELSARVDRIVDLGGRILRMLEEDPERAGQLRSFLGYYLPTTRKLLESYAAFESSGLDSENLAASRKRIAAAMAQLEEGYRHQLDALYRADTLDVETEIRVMEAMLRRDLGSVERDFDLR